MRKSKKLSILILITLFLVSMTPDKAEAKHFEFLNQILDINNLLGCLFILIGVLLSQLLPLVKKKYS